MVFLSKMKLSRRAVGRKRHEKNLAEKAAKLAAQRSLLLPNLEQEPTPDDPEPPQSNYLPEEPEFLLEIKEERLEEVFDPNPVRNSHNSESPTLFCSLCLRQCLEEQIQKFSHQSWVGASFEDRRGKLEQMLGGVQIDGDICRTCWRMVELAVDFRQSCLKMVELKERFPVGAARKDEDEEEWFAGGHLEGLGRTRKMVQDHVERVEFAEVSLRNAINMKVEEGFGDDMALLEEDTHVTEDHFEEDLKINSNESTENVEEPGIETESTPAEPIPIPLFTCSTCNRSFESKGSLHIHQNYCNSSKTIRTYSCTICSANFMCYASLIGHLNKHKGVKPFQCSKPSCTKTFYSRVEWRHHELSCGASPFVCALCGVTIKSYSAFRAHKAKHTERTSRGMTLRDLAKIASNSTLFAHRPFIVVVFCSSRQIAPDRAHRAHRGQIVLE